MSDVESLDTMENRNLTINNDRKNISYIILYITISCILFHFSLTSKCSYCNLHFLGKETEAQKDLMTDSK